MARFISAGVAGALLLASAATGAAKIPDNKIKIGILGAPPAEETGNGAIVAAQLAASDFATEFLKGDGEILPAASDRSPDSTADQVRDWLDKEHVAAVVSSAGPLINRRIADMVAKRQRTLLVTSTGEDPAQVLCRPDVIVWSAGPAARATALVRALQPVAGKRWLLVGDRSPADLAGQAALRDAVAAAGGQIAGQIDDVSSDVDMRKAVQKMGAADAAIVALTQSDGTLSGVLRGIHAAGLPRQAAFAAPYARIADIDAAGVAAAEGLVVTAPFYWDTNDDTRRFTRRWRERMHELPITANAAEVYTATLGFLRAAKAVDDLDARKVIGELRRSPIQHTPLGTVVVHADGQAIHDLGVYRVKPQEQIQQRWAYYTRMDSVPGATAFLPAACPQLGAQPPDQTGGK